MLLDNRTTTEEHKYFKVITLLTDYAGTGNLDIVTGYFSVNALARLYDEANQAKSFRMVLGELLKDDNTENKIIDLLGDSLSINHALNLSLCAKKAVQFLAQEKVKIRTVQSYFCHAKAYVYRDPDPRKHFYIVGSSNLTDAGLGLKPSANIELNIAETGNSNDYKELTKWFQQLWEGGYASDKILLPGKKKTDCKEYLISLIQNLFKEYRPEDIYYKVLYELFKEDLHSFALDAEFKREIAYLENTVIYKTLYSFQQKGLISLIRMLQKENGAILADAVGLGKTWSALAVMKYFELKGYKVLIFCPKKLENNWRQYLEGHRSKFEDDRLKYVIRFHTDLQDNRLENYQDGFGIKVFFQGNPKLLILIDESHNFRNDKSSRYKFLVENILQKNNDVKVLQLSATPINNRLTDIRNQFKLIKKGHDDGFKNSEAEIPSLRSLFSAAQKDFKKWQESSERKLKDFIQILPQNFFDLSDALIVARTRKMIENEFGELFFPKKEKPANEYINPENIGEFKSFDDIFNAMKVNLTAYRPSEYIKGKKAVSILFDSQQREKFLVKMMFILLMKRLESGWFSFKNTVGTILNHHENALDKVNSFINFRNNDADLDADIGDEEFAEGLEETASEYGMSASDTDNETKQIRELTLGKKNPVSLSAISNIENFKAHLEADIAKLKALKSNLDLYEKELADGKKTDNKLDKLVEHIEKKRISRENQKILIFTVFKDTAQYLFNSLRKKGYTKIAYISGSSCETDEGGSHFYDILDRFAPYTKLFKEKDWRHVYEECREKQKDAFRLPETFDEWKAVIRHYDPQTFKKLENPVDILIATDCLSEGQNLQDCDCVINYDIHWNPVRIIQRMGRIDRIGSPNKNIMGINFWTGKDYEDYLRLKNRVENRMALMSIAGAEIDERMTPEMEEMVRDNPILSRQAEKMLKQLEITWDDIETSDDTIGLNDLSLEQFRHELFEFFQKNREQFEKMPNGIFTGFKAVPDEKYPELPDGIIALLGYPKKPKRADNYVYRELFLLYSHTKGFSIYNNTREILSILRKHKYQPRYVPEEIEKGDENALTLMSKRIKDWIAGQAPKKAINGIQSLFENGISLKKTPEEIKLEEKFQPENFDLITWVVVNK